MIRILIITHGEFGREMLKTAEGIVGKQEGVNLLAVTTGDSLSSMCEHVGAIVRGIDDPDGTLILADMIGGTPCNACLPFCRDFKIDIVTGLNLYMLLAAFMGRSTLTLEELAHKVVADGKRNIADAKEIFLKKLQ
jgi:PTS system mannose-specific IIA component